MCFEYLQNGGLFALDGTATVDQGVTCTNYRRVAV